jgi:hypothetical protein
MKSFFRGLAGLLIVMSHTPKELLNLDLGLGLHHYQTSLICLKFRDSLLLLILEKFHFDHHSLTKFEVVLPLLLVLGIPNEIYIAFYLLSIYREAELTSPSTYIFGCGAGMELLPSDRYDILV